MKSHHVPGEEFVDGVVVNQRGEEMVKVWGEWYTKAEAERVRQENHEYLEARKQEREAEKAERNRQYEIQEQIYKNGRAREYDGYADYSNTPENRALETRHQRSRKIEYQDTTTKFQDVVLAIGTIIFVLIVGGGALFAAILSMP